MKIVQTRQGDTLANLDQEGPNVKKTAKICYADGKTRFSQNRVWRLDYKGQPANQRSSGTMAVKMECM